MKLSELKGERAVEVIADLIAPLTNIAVDQENSNIFQVKKKEGESEREMGIRGFKENVPNLLRTHKQDILDILCAIEDCDPEDLSIIDIVQGAKELLNDMDFINLFLSAANRGDKTSPTESSAIAEHTEPES